MRRWATSPQQADPLVKENRPLVTEGQKPCLKLITPIWTNLHNSEGEFPTLLYNLRKERGWEIGCQLTVTSPDKPVSWNRSSGPTSGSPDSSRRHQPREDGLKWAREINQRCTVAGPAAQARSASPQQLVVTLWVASSQIKHNYHVKNSAWNRQELQQVPLSAKPHQGVSFFSFLFHFLSVFLRLFLKDSPLAVVAHKGEEDVNFGSTPASSTPCCLGTERCWGGVPGRPEVPVCSPAFAWTNTNPL